MTIKITNVEQIHRANLTSIGKRPKSDWRPTYEWAIEQLHAQDSTLEMADIFIEAEVSGSVAGHVVRATKGHPRVTVESHRPDWTGKPRPASTALRHIFIKTNPYALIEMCRQRLCSLAEKDTRQFFINIVDEMHESDDMFLYALSEYLMPDCQYRGHVCHMRKKAWATCQACRHWSESDVERD